MADVDPDLEAAAEALWNEIAENDSWSTADDEDRENALEVAAAVLAALRAEGWQKADEDARNRQKIVERLEADPEWQRQVAESYRLEAAGELGPAISGEELSFLLTRPTSVGEMGAAQAEPESLDHDDPLSVAYWSGYGKCAENVMKDMLRNSAPMSHAVLGDETSTSGGVGIPSAAVPEQPSLAESEALARTLHAWTSTKLWAEVPDHERGIWRYKAKLAFDAIAAARGVSDSEAGQ